MQCILDMFLDRIWVMVNIIIIINKYYSLGFYILQGLVVWRQVNSNPGLKTNWSVNISCMKMLFPAYVFL